VTTQGGRHSTKLLTLHHLPPGHIVKHLHPIRNPIGKALGRGGADVELMVPMTVPFVGNHARDSASGPNRTDRGHEVIVTPCQKRF